MDYIIIGGGMIFTFLKYFGFKITPDAVLGWEPVPEAIKDPEIFERVTKLVNEELKNFFRT